MTAHRIAVATQPPSNPHATRTSTRPDRCVTWEEAIDSGRIPCCAVTFPMTMLTSLPTLSGKGVDKAEFIVGMLTKLELISEDDVEPFIAQFESLDVDGSGRLTEADLKRMVEEKARKQEGLPAQGVT